jgi:hypothetical protein
MKTYGEVYPHVFLTSALVGDRNKWKENKIIYSYLVQNAGQHD